VQGNRVVALGDQVVGGVALPLAELSTNSGATFKPVPFSAASSDAAGVGAAGVGAAFTALTADAGGFTAALQSGTPGQSGAPGRQQATIWTSADGTSWTRSGGGGLTGSGTSRVGALAASGGAAGGKITAIGSGTSQKSAQPVVRTFVDR
jgi:hypothetical protein